MIRAARAEVLVARTPLPEAFAARAGGGGRGHALLRLATDDGRVGQGEAAPLPGYSDESFDDVAAQLTRLARTAMPLELDEEPGAADVDAALADARLGAAARFACETALLDLAALGAGVGLAGALSGRRTAAPGVPVNRLLPSAGGEADLIAAVEAGLARGVTTFKLKVGRAPRFEDDLARVRALRERFGDAIALRLDANEAWALDEARRNLARLAPLRPALVEQPVARDVLALLVDSPVPLAADESLQVEGELERLLDARTVAAVVVKPAAVGGLLRARRLAGLAAAAGVDVIVTHLLDGPVGVAAAAELALSLDAPPAPSGLAAHPGLARWAVRPPQLRDDRVVPAGPGLGLPLVEPPP